MRGCIKVNIPKFMMVTVIFSVHAYFTMNRCCWENKVVRFRPNQPSNVLRSFRWLSDRELTESSFAFKSIFICFLVRAGQALSSFLLGKLIFIHFQNRTV